ncbi:MAG: hypothetical protein PHF57_03135 [Methanoregula sp.]|nr:hypothetical protein [Methanoregula sp.]
MKTSSDNRTYMPRYPAFSYPMPDGHITRYTRFTSVTATTRCAIRYTVCEMPGLFPEMYGTTKT